MLYSESTPEGRKITKLDQILLNGNNITMLVPGGEYPSLTLAVVHDMYMWLQVGYVRTKSLNYLHDGIAENWEYAYIYSGTSE